MSGAAFGLYPNRDLVATQRVAAGRTALLHSPVDADGVTLFRVSYWLPVPAVIAVAQALRLAPAELQLRFDTAEFDVPLSDRDWFPTVRTIASQLLRIEFAWPATLARINRPAGRDRHAVKLFRADGDAVAGQPTQAGVTGTDLVPPWVGSPLVLEIGAVVAGLDRVAKIGSGLAVGVRGASGGVSGVADKVDPIASVGGGNLVGGLRLAGRPTSPRMKLVAEHGAASVLLWQALLPGEHAQATLPERSVGDEWSDALEQLRASAVGADGAPERLRLDIESDAPCTVTFTRLDLGLHAELELLAQPQKFSFSGDRPEERTLALALPAGGAPQALRLTGRVVGDAQDSAAAGAVPADARHGALLFADRAALQPIALAQPLSIAGLALCWQPLSSRLRLRLRLLADGGNRPGSRVLAQATQSFDTPIAGWIALRWSAIDLQPQRVWAEAALLEGAGLWLFDDAPTPAGWTTALAEAALREALPNGLRLHPLAPPPPGSPARAIALRIGSQPVAPSLDVAALALDIPAQGVALLATDPLTFTGSARAIVSVDSARLEVAA